MVSRAKAALGVVVVCLVFSTLALAHASSNAHSHDHHHLDTSILKPKTATYGHKCIYDERQASSLPAKRVDQGFDVEEITETGIRVKVKRAANWQPFRVTLALDNLSGDSYTCYTAGTTVPVDGGGTYTCTSADIMDSTMLDYLNNSMIQAAIHRFSTLLDVDRAAFITVTDNSATGCSTYVTSHSYHYLLSSNH